MTTFSTLMKFVAFRFCATLALLYYLRLPLGEKASSVGDS